jgi:hypothetical protein
MINSTIAMYTKPAKAKKLSHVPMVPSPNNPEKKSTMKLAINSMKATNANSVIRYFAISHHHTFYFGFPPTTTKVNGHWEPRNERNNVGVYLPLRIVSNLRAKYKARKRLVLRFDLGLLLISLIALLM